MAAREEGGGKRKEKNARERASSEKFRTTAQGSEVRRDRGCVQLKRVKFHGVFPDKSDCACLARNHEKDIYLNNAVSHLSENEDSY